MRKIISWLLIIAVGGIGIVFLPQVKAAQGDITLKHLAGQVQYKSSSWLFFSSKWKTLDNSTVLSNGDLIKTGSEGQAQLTFANQARTLIKSNSKLKITANDRGLGLTKVKLSLGEILVKFVNTVKSDQQFEVETPSATAGVRGTIFRVVVNEEEETQVAVSEGKVEVSSDGGKVVVEKGEGAVVREKKDRPEVVPAEKIEVKQQGRARGKEKGTGKPEEEWLKENKEWAKKAKREAKQKAEEAKENAKDKDDHPGKGNDKGDDHPSAGNDKEDDHPGVGNDKDGDHPGSNNSSNASDNIDSDHGDSESDNSSNSSNGSGSSNSKGGGRP